MTKTKLFHVQESILKANGFTKEVVNERNGTDDVINTAKFEYFTKEFNDGLRLSVNYTYLTLNERDYELYQSNVELEIDHEWVEIPVKRLSDFLNLTRILSGDE